MHTGLYIFLGLLSLCVAYHIQPSVIDGVPDFVDVNAAPFEKIGNNFYYIETSKKNNWYGASQVCGGMDAKLLYFESLEEWNLVNNYLNKIDNITKMFWTSGSNLANENTHVWFSNGEPISLDIWYEGEPNNANDEENCDVMGSSFTDDFGMNDKKCTLKYYYICKAAQPKTAAVIVW